MENHVDQVLLEKKLNRCLTPRAVGALIAMSALMAMTMITANLSATKIWSLGGIPVDGGILLFPLSYVLGDLLVEIYGKRIADSVAWASCGVGLLAAAFIALARMLPDYPGADNGGFLTISGVVGRIFLASIVGFLASQLCNNYVFERVRRKQRNGAFWKRALFSSVLAHIPDILLFEPIAFFGKLSFMEFVEQAVFAYVAAIVIEGILLLLVTKRLARQMVYRLKFQHGKRITSQGGSDTQSTKES